MGAFDILPRKWQRNDIDAIAGGRMLQNRDLVPIVSLDGPTVFLQAARQEQISHF